MIQWKSTISQPSQVIYFMHNNEKFAYNVSYFPATLCHEVVKYLGFGPLKPIMRKPLLGSNGFECINISCLNIGSIPEESIVELVECDFWAKHREHGCGGCGENSITAPIETISNTVPENKDWLDQYDSYTPVDLDENFEQSDYYQTHEQKSDAPAPYYNDYSLCGRIPVNDAISKDAFESLHDFPNITNNEIPQSTEAPKRVGINERFAEHLNEIERIELPCIKSYKTVHHPHTRPIEFDVICHLNKGDPIFTKYTMERLLSSADIIDNVHRDVLIDIELSYTNAAILELDQYNILGTQNIGNYPCVKIKNKETSSIYWITIGKAMRLFGENHIRGMTFKCPQCDCDITFNNNIMMVCDSGCGWVFNIANGYPRNTVESQPKMKILPYYGGAPSFVLFYLSDCAYCEKIMPIWYKLFQSYNGREVNISKINRIGNETICDKYNIIEFPTIRYYKNRLENHNDYVEYTETDHTFENISGFLNKMLRIAKIGPIKKVPGVDNDWSSDEL